MPITLYRRQKQILSFIKQYIDKYGYSPTLGEIAEAIGVSSLATVHEHLQALVHKGVIKKFAKEYFGSMKVEKLVLFSSALTAKGPIYTVVKEFSLS